MSFSPDTAQSPAETSAETPPPPPGGSVCADDAVARRERQQAVLAELTEAGLEIALALKTRIVETAALEPDAESARACADLARAFDRASRAVRMTIALSERIAKDAAGGAQATRSAAHYARTERAGRVRRIVGRVAIGFWKDRPVCELLDRQVRERLFDPDISGELGDRPIGALVAQICFDLGLPVDWRTLAEEAWAQAEITERPVGSPYAAWPELPPDPEDLDPDDNDLWLSDEDPEDDFQDGDERDAPQGADP
ncbi:MAG: hypothetical protein JWP35_1621 [Caulobacter sp.]|nr:hypothetical protein [Caulobacter sp.]